ncbi:MAG: transglutaminase family protein [Halothiobacillus sp.]
MFEIFWCSCAFDDAWFVPFLEFRFPCYGTVTYEGVTIEVRQAIEPWHVLGEEMAAGGTARYVDSSIERVQIIEYVQRFDGFQGFFARDNVAKLTFAAGLEEGVQAEAPR